MLHKHNLTSYLIQADVIRVLAIIGTLTIHYLYPIYSRPDFLGGTSWWVAAFLNTLARPSIPLFIMLSGSLLISKNESVNANLKRTVQRLVVPFGIWAVVYFFWNVLVMGHALTTFDFVSMFATGAVFHLYFLVILIGLYLFLPMIRAILSQASSEIINYLVELSLGAGIVLYLVQYLLVPNFPLLNSFTIWFPYLGYFLLGFLLMKPLSNKKIPYKWLYLGSVIVTLLLGYLNLFLLSKGITIFMKNGISYFDEYLSPNVVLMSISLYQLLYHSSSLRKKVLSSALITRAIQELARAAFAVYIIHFIVLNILDNLGFSFERFQINLLLFIVLKGLILFISTFSAALILIRLPFIKLAFGEKP